MPKLIRLKFRLWLDSGLDYTVDRLWPRLIRLKCRLWVDSGLDYTVARLWLRLLRLKLLDSDLDWLRLSVDCGLN